MPTMGLSAAWFDPTQPTAWSGITANLIAALERLGVYGGFRDATPWLPRPGALKVAATLADFAQHQGRRRSVALVRHWLRRTGRASTWVLSPEMRVAGTLTNAVRRLAKTSEYDCWLVLAADRAVRRPFVTMADMSPHQFVHVGPAAPASWWTPGATKAEMVGHARRLAKVHRLARACCVASHWAGASLVGDDGVDPQRVHVVGFGHNIKLDAAPHRDWSVPRFLWVGHDWYRKNGDAVVRAFTRVRGQFPRAALDLVGHHPSLDVAGVTGHGELSRADLSGAGRLDDLFRRATSFVMPSFVEPFGIVYLEAAAAGLPSIATAVGGTADSVGPGGVLVDPHDDDALYSAMRRVCDSGEAAALGAAGYRHASLFTWDKVAERVVRAAGLQVPGTSLAEFL